MAKMRASAAFKAERKVTRRQVDLYPTPPWATRALCEWLLAEGEPLSDMSMWDPACGRGDMIYAAREYFHECHASDAFQHASRPGMGNDYKPEIYDFLFTAQENVPHVDWLITNPPFTLSDDFAEHAHFRLGFERIALLCRLQWLEGRQRYERIFRPMLPNDILVFSDRVGMCPDRVDAGVAAATAYAWFVWRPVEHVMRLGHIPPGQKRSLWRDGDEYHI